MKKIIILMLTYCSMASSEVYKWTDSDGKIHFGDNPAKNISATTVKLENINSFTSSDYLPIKNAVKENKIIMFSTSWCTYCAAARKYFFDNNIKFVELDVEKNIDAKNYYDSMGLKGVPVIMYKQKKMTGFSVAGLKNLIN